MNDWAWITYEQRQMLKPFAPKLLFTASSKTKERQRAYMIANWALKSKMQNKRDVVKMQEKFANLGYYSNEVGLLRNLEYEYYENVVSYALRMAKERKDFAGSLKMLGRLVK